MNGWSTVFGRAGLVAALALVPACDIYFGHEGPPEVDAGVWPPDAGVDAGGYGADSGVDASQAAYDLLYTRWQGGPQIVLGSFDGDVRVVAAADGGVALASRAAVSPDGGRVAYATFDGAVGAWALRVRDLRTGADIQVASMLGSAAPSWSPDGTRVAYASEGVGVFVVPAAGGAPTLIAADTRADECTAPRFSPDGAALSFGGGVGVSIHRFADGTTAMIAPAAGACAPAWSPDSASLVFTDNGAGALERVDATGGPVTIVAPLYGGLGIGQAAWSPDGAHIAYVDFDYGVSDTALRVVDAAGGSPRVLDHLHAGIGAGHPVWSPDATTLLYVGFDSGFGARLMLVDTVSGDTVALPHVGASIDGTYPAWLPRPIVLP